MEACKLLIKYGAKIDVKSNKDGLTPLQLALDRNESPELIALLSNKVDLNIFEIIGTNNIEKLEQYIKNKKDLNVLKDNRESPLFVAVKEKKVKIVQIILENSEIYWSKNDGRYNPLFLAGQNGDVELLNLFFKYAKIEPDLLNEALWFACEYEKVEASQLLIEKGARLDAKIKGSRRTSFDSIMEKGDSRMLELLKINGIQLEFWAACRIGDMSLVKQLLTTKNLKLFNYEGKSALHYAVLNNNLELATILVESKLLLNEIDPTDNDKSALAQAAELGNFKIVEILVKNKCEINQAGKSSIKTALSYAVNKEYFEIVKFLLENGADPNIYRPVDRNVNPMLKACKKHKTQEIYDLLIKYGAK